ncbi:hypothetical protein [Piscinibacter sp.]|uniref:hypothetical protein n=1 Tax=Piscinibacter sp. TaxID=1903157 RepID=UPI00355A9509
MNTTLPIAAALPDLSMREMVMVLLIHGTVSGATDHSPCCAAAGRPTTTFHVL